MVQTATETCWLLLSDDEIVVSVPGFISACVICFLIVSAFCTFLLNPCGLVVYIVYVVHNSIISNSPEDTYISI